MTICIIWEKSGLVGVGHAAGIEAAQAAAVAELKKKSAGQELKKKTGTRNHMMTVAQAARYLDISPQAVLKLVRNQGLPYRLVDGEIRFTKKGLNAWLEKISVVPSEA